MTTENHFADLTKMVGTDREKLVDLLESAESSCYWNSEDKGFIQKIADHLYENGVTFVSVNNFGCKLIPYEERVKTYMNAMITYGDEKQMIVALEELSECQKEICKILRGGENFSHLAEEIADAAIMLEQMCMIFGLEDQVCEHMDRKVQRLDNNLKKYFTMEE